jgi:RNA polymerase sigma-70 factor (ECF subfamily)
MAVTSRGFPGLLSDPEAFTGFYRQALPRVYGYLLSRCAGAAWLAEDLTQETFLAAVAEIKRGRLVGDPMPWIVRIARNKFVDHIRRSGRDERKLVKIWEAQQRAWDPPSLTIVEGRALGALRSVPLAQRAALSLRYQDGLAVREIAQALGRSVHATESLIARGKETFRRYYEQGEDHD